MRPPETDLVVNDPEVVELQLDGETAVEDELVITHAAQLWPRALSIGAIALVLLAGWRLLSPTDDAAVVEESTPPTTQPVGDNSAGRNVVVPGTVATAPTNTPVAANADPFPLFGEDSGLTVAVLTRDGPVLLDADSGAIRRIRTPRNSLANEFEGFFGGSVGLAKFGEQLVVQNDGRAIGYPLDGGVSIDFGRADVFFVEDDRLITFRDLALGIERPQVLRFDEGGTQIGETIGLPDAVWPLGGANFAGPGGVYRLSDDGFALQSPGVPVAAGPGHMLVYQCDDHLDCHYQRLDLATAEIDEVDSPFGDGQARFFGGGSLSPDGEFLASIDYVGLGRRWDLYALATSEKIELTDPLPSSDSASASWSPDSRFLATIVSTGEMAILDVETRSVKRYWLADLGLKDVLRPFAVLDLQGL